MISKLSLPILLASANTNNGDHPSLFAFFVFLEILTNLFFFTIIEKD